MNAAECLERNEGSLSLLGVPRAYENVALDHVDALRRLAGSDELKQRVDNLDQCLQRVKHPDDKEAQRARRLIAGLRGPGGFDV